MKCVEAILQSNQDKSINVGQKAVFSLRYPSSFGIKGTYILTGSPIKEAHLVTWTGTQGQMWALQGNHYICAKFLRAEMLGQKSTHSPLCIKTPNPFNSSSPTTAWKVEEKQCKVRATRCPLMSTRGFEGCLNQAVISHTQRSPAGVKCLGHQGASPAGSVGQVPNPCYLGKIQEAGTFSGLQLTNNLWGAPRQELKICYCRNKCAEKMNKEMWRMYTWQKHMCYPLSQSECLKGKTYLKISQT